MAIGKALIGCTLAACGWSVVPALMKSPLTSWMSKGAPFMTATWQVKLLLMATMASLPMTKPVLGLWSVAMYKACDCQRPWNLVEITAVDWAGSNTC